MSVKVTVERADDKPGISLKDGDVCLLRCGGVVMVEDTERPGKWPIRGYFGELWARDGVYSNDEQPHSFDVLEVLGNGADFLKRVEVVVKVRGE